MKALRWVPAVTLCIVTGSIVGPAGAAAGQADQVLTAATAPSCMKQSTYKAIKKDMTYRRVNDIIAGQKPAFVGPKDTPYFIYEGCGWTGGDGIILQYYKNFDVPLRKARLLSKALNPCGTRPGCF